MHFSPPPSIRSFLGGRKLSTLSVDLVLHQLKNHHFIWKHLYCLSHVVQSHTHNKLPAPEANEPRASKKTFAWAVAPSCGSFVSGQVFAPLPQCYQKTDYARFIRRAPDSQWSHVWVKTARKQQAIQDLDGLSLEARILLIWKFIWHTLKIDF